MRVRRFRAAATLLAAGALVLTACGGDDDAGDAEEPTADENGEAPEELAPLVLGMTDTATNIDPAGSYDKPSWNIAYNVYQRLLWVPSHEDQPQPDAAESCDWVDDTTYQCTMKDGLVFSDGSPLTAENVKHSIDRNLAIQHETGGFNLLTNIESVETPDESTVIFTLAEPDATFPFRLTTAAASIVPMEFPADDLQPNDQVFGSGPYTVEAYDPTSQIRLGINENYAGDKEIKNSGVIMQVYQDESVLRQAIEQGEVMMAYRSLSVTDIADLQERGGDFGVEVVIGDGAEINYMVLQVGREPFNEPAVRQAVAQIIDRDAIVETVYRGTVTPLYGPIPDGVAGHVPSYLDRYGEPNVDAAAQLLEDAGVETPVEFDLWFMPDRYGAEIVDMYGEIARQLEDSGLFTVNQESLSWAQYATTFSDGSMDAFDLGWFPDFPDASNYLGPFYDSEANIMGTGYENAEMDELIATIETEQDQDARVAAMERASEIVAEDVPIIQLWQRDQVAAIREGVTGLEDTFDPSFIVYYNVISGISE